MAAVVADDAKNTYYDIGRVDNSCVNAHKTIKMK